MKLILSTGNIVSGGPSVIRRLYMEKSNVELVNSLRYNIVAAQHVEPSHANDAYHDTHSPPQKLSYSDDYTTWTSKDGNTLHIPAVDFSVPGLSEARSQYDITVKLFYLPGIPASRRCEHTAEAIDLVLKELHVDSIDLLIVSFPDISFDADDESDEEEVTNGETESEHESMVKTWRVLESLHEKGTIAQLGLAEFDSTRLAKFLPDTKVRPAVDQINVKDCCVVPKSLIMYAKQENIELLTHNDCTDILSRGTTRDLLSRTEKGAGILAATADSDDGGIKGDVEPQWVVKYTAVVKDRGVIENKGYFARAEVGSCIPPSE